MFTVRVGNIRMAKRANRGRVLPCILLLVPAAVFITFILQKYSDKLYVDRGQTRSLDTLSPPKLCAKRDCPVDQFSFFIQSGAANVVPPKICFQNELVLGSIKNNAGHGINVVTINGITGEITKTGSFNMYSGDVKPLIEMLKNIETGTVVLIASYDDPSSKLNEDARKLIAELGSTSIKSLGFRDNWVFVGGKGSTVKSTFENYLKNDNAKNKYEKWPELITIDGCIPKYLE